jgi:hypothetical protein
MSDEQVPWSLKQAVDGRAPAPATGYAEDAEPEANDAPADAPISKFRRVSGATGMQAAASPTRPPTRASSPMPPPPPPSRAAAAPTRAYTPPPPPPPMEWDSEVETLRPQSMPTTSYSSPPPPPPPRSSGPSGNPYAPTPAKKRGGGVIAAVVVGALVLAGAGVGGVVLAMKGGAPSRTEFVADADDICRPANGPVAAIVKPTSYPELATAAGTVSTTVNAQVGQLRALDQPGGEAKAEVAGVLAALEGTSAAAKRLQDAAGDQDDTATIAATKDMASQATDARTRATTSGFAACSIGMQPGIDAVFGGTQSVIKAGFVAQADVLCRRAANDTEDIDFPQSDTGRALAAFLGELIALFDDLVDDIRALPVAPGDEATVSEILTAQDKVQDKNREVQDAAADEDIDRFDALNAESVTLTTAADAKWDAYGLGSCGSNFGF